MYAENMEQDPEADAFAESPPEVDAEEADPEEEGEGQDEVREMAIVALGLLKQEAKVMLHQVKQLVKANSQLASQVSFYLAFVCVCVCVCVCCFLT